jgi:fibronectin-binding autotransporter adhesin
MLTNNGWWRWRASVIAVASLLVAIFGLSGTAHALPNLVSNTLVSSVNPSTPGQSVTFTVTVTGQGGENPTADGGARSITFNDGGSALATVTLTSTGALTATATFTTLSLAAGTHSIVGHFNGSGGYNPGDSNTVSQVVAAPATPTPSNGNNVGGNLHQSTEFTSQQIVSSSTTSMTDSLEDGFSGPGGGGGGGGSGAIGGRVVAAAIPPLGTRTPGLSGPGLSGYTPSRMQALTMLAQAAHSAVMSDGGSGAPQQIALGPTGLAYNSGKPFGAFASFAYSGVGSSQTGGQSAAMSRPTRPARITNPIRICSSVSASATS